MNLKDKSIFGTQKNWWAFSTHEKALEINPQRASVPFISMLVSFHNGTGLNLAHKMSGDHVRPW